MTRHRTIVLGLLTLFVLGAGSGGVGWSSADAADAPRDLYRVGPLKSGEADAVGALGLDVAGHGPGATLDLILSPSEVAALAARGITARPFAAPWKTLHAAALGPLAKPGLGAYHTYNEAVAEMAQYVAAHPARAVLDTIGVSVEGRPLIAVKVSDSAALDEPEPEVLIVGCHHARELMSVEVPLYLMRRLLDGYGVDPVVTSLVEGREIWILPVVNPDGYTYVEQNATGQPSGWWRKNRRPNADGSIGVDLNRNYGFNWGYDNVGSSPNPPAETYRGTGPFSEPETSGLRDWIEARAFTLSVSFHSYGELLLYPWGYARLDTPEHRIFAALGDSVSVLNGYRAGNPKSGAIYLTNGDMDDWVYGEQSTKPALFGFTFELNHADDGFAPSEGLIAPTCELNWGPLLTLLRYGDEPRRIVGPARPATPVVAVLESAVSLNWGYAAPDPHNPPVRHEVRRIDAFSVGVDDAESGAAAWDTLGFTVSAARASSGTSSYYSGTGDGRRSTLTTSAGAQVSPGDSLVVQAFWDLESDYDYWYTEVSDDGGTTWSLLAGNRTTDLNPFGRNEGDGITGASGGLIKRATFALDAYAGRQVRVRFRVVTDGSIHGEGVYIDDIEPTAFETSGFTIDTASADSIYALDPPPSVVTWYKVRAVDGEGHAGNWSERVVFDPTVTAVETEPRAPLRDWLETPSPNPSNPEARVAFTLGRGAPGPYRLTLYDASGRRLGTIAEGWDSGAGARQSARVGGRHARGEALASGIYFLRLETIRGATARKITILR